jgi:hypothetical protein
MIRSQTEKYVRVTRTDPRRHCKAKYSRSSSRGWVDSFILRHKTDSSETKSTPEDDVRLEVPRAFLDETVNGLREHIQGMKTKLIVNLEEIRMGGS